LGNTFTVTVKDAPGHPFATGVTVYVAVRSTFVEFVNVPDIFVAFVPAAPPVNPTGSEGADQLYVVPGGTIVADVGTPFCGTMVNGPPVHIESFSAGITGLGLITIGFETTVAPQLFTTLSLMV
jgi:hypothetical protein